MSGSITVVPGSDDSFFFEGAALGELRLRRCADCGALRHPPTPMCTVCHSTALDWLVASGIGTVYTWIIGGHPSGDGGDAPIIALVDLPEGCRLVTNLVEVDGADLEIGAPVEVRFVEHDGVTLPCFAPVAAA